MNYKKNFTDVEGFKKRLNAQAEKINSVQTSLNSDLSVRSNFNGDFC